MANNPTRAAAKLTPPPAWAVKPLAMPNYDDVGQEAARLPADFVPFATLKEARTGKRNGPAA